MIKCVIDTGLTLYRVERKPVIVLLVMVVLSVPIIPLELGVIQLLIDRIQQWSASVSFRPIVEMVIWLAIVMIMNNIVIGLPMPLAMTRLSEIGTLEERRLILRKNCRLPLALIESPKVKDLRLKALQISLYGCYNTGIHLLQMALQIVVLMAILLVYDQWIPVVGVILTLCVLLYASLRTSKQIEQVKRDQTPSTRLLKHYAELITKRETAKEVRLFGLGRLLTERWVALYETQSSIRQNVIRASELLLMGPQLLAALFSGIILALLVLLPGKEGLSAGSYAMLFLTLTRLLTLIPQFVAQSVLMGQNVMRWHDYRLFMALEENEQTVEQSSEASIHTEGGFMLEVKDLSFTYTGTAHEALRGINLTIPIGCRAAVVGENGSGKSTLVKLLTLLYKPNKGEIHWIDGLGNKVGGTSVRNQMSAVFQDFAPLYLTVRENVALGKYTAFTDDNALHKSLILSGIGKKLRDLDLQLGAVFGGPEPSGGEWQKIVTARAIVRDAAFVFFDEPTAALDPQAEKEAFELFLKVTEGRSALLVTHRLGAARLADLIFVMKDGCLIEQGTHDELMQLNGEYGTMFRMQAEWYQ